MTEASQRALATLRSAENFDWYVIPLVAVVAYLYVNEAHKGEWHILWTAIIFYFGELCWEMLNALILHFSSYAPLWSAPERSAFLILVGLNIEISVMFAIAPLVVLKSLPRDPALRILGIPNRILVPVGWALLCVGVETILYYAGALVWDYWWWRWPHIYFIVIAYSLPFVLIAWIHDRMSLKAKGRAAALMVVVTALSWGLFSSALGWI